eukprot:Hpha_TRINITY_DN15635_c3_g1::TRINITY_DN15635_c3_g1_i3::g.101903::m.101903
MGGCCSWMEGLVVRKSDTPEDAHIKRLLFPAAMFFLCFILPVSLFGFSRGSWERIVLIFNMLVQFIFVAGVAFNLAPARRLVDVYLITGAVGVCLLDIISFAHSSVFRSWFFVVLVLDLALVFSRDHIPSFVIPCVLLYLSLLTVESIHRYGITDLGYWGSSVEDNACNCASPPCSRAAFTAIYTFITSTVVLLLDFWFTRGFANNLTIQLRSIQASVEVSERVAAALAEYNVDAAETAIAADTDLPSGLRVSYKQLLYNLRSYKAYLPHSCLVREEDPDLPAVECAREPTGDRKRSSASSSRRVSRRFSHKVSRDSTSTETTVTTDESLTLLVRGLKAAARTARVTLAAGNKIGYLTTVAALAGASNADWIAGDVERWCVSVAQAKGVVDVISGDRRFASFNARQGCGSHAAAAVEVLSSRGEGEWSGCVVNGQAICGDFGSLSTQRFMVLGRVSCSLHPLERLAAKWRISMLGDESAYSSACYTWNGKLLGAVFLAKRGAKALRLYKMTTKRSGGDKAENMEWMYELARMGEGEFEAENEAAAMLIKSKLDGISEVELEEVSEGVTVEGGTVVWKLDEVGVSAC